MSEWLAMRNVDFRYGDTPVLQGLDVTLGDDCRVLAVIGRSGVGKSTLLALLAGHLAPSRGAIGVCGETVRGPGASRPMVFQDHNLFPWMTVLANVAFGLKCAGVALAERERQGRELLGRMGLEDVERLYPAALSGGMRQRVGLARALAVQPACLLMDEPFHALDAWTRERLQADFATQLARTRARAVMVTHDVDEAAKLADHVLVLHSAVRHELVRVDARTARACDAAEPVSESRAAATRLRNLLQTTT